MEITILLRVDNAFETLSLSWRKSLSSRNHSIDLQSKPMDWFLYDSDLRHERVNSKLAFTFNIEISELKYFCNIKNYDDV